MLEVLPWAEVCDRVNSAMDWATYPACSGDGSDVEEDPLLSTQGEARVTGLIDEEEEEGDAEYDEDDDEEERRGTNEAQQSSPEKLIDQSSSLASLVKKVRKGLLCMDEEDDEGLDLETKPLFDENDELVREKSTGRQEPKQDASHILFGRYEYVPSNVVGSGGFSTVRRAIDLVTGRPVAIKTFQREAGDADSDDEDKGEGLLKQFRDEVRMLGILHNTPSGGCSPTLDGNTSFVLTEATLEVGRQIFDELPPSSDLFVELVDFSRQGDSEPCPSEHMRLQSKARIPSRYPEHQAEAAADGQCYLVLELAIETLQQYLARVKASKATLPGTKAQRIFREICEVVAALHSRGFVHVDLKPENLMRFPSGRFKLIDMDGMQECGSSVPVSDLIVTSKYCAPEVAVANLKDNETDDHVLIRISRLLDVFSLGLIGLELFAGSHPLEDIWRRVRDADPDDDEGFLQHLSSPGLEVPISPTVRDISVALEDLLRSMLRAQHRASMPEVIANPFFREILEPLPHQADGALRRVSSSDPAVRIVRRRETPKSVLNTAVPSPTGNPPACGSPRAPATAPIRPTAKILFFPPVACKLDNDAACHWNRQSFAYSRSFVEGGA